MYFYNSCLLPYINFKLFNFLTTIENYSPWGDSIYKYDFFYWQLIVHFTKAIFLYRKNDFEGFKIF